MGALWFPALLAGTAQPCGGFGWRGRSRNVTAAATARKGTTGGRHDGYTKVIKLAPNIRMATKIQNTANPLSRAAVQRNGGMM